MACRLSRDLGTRERGERHTNTEPTAETRQDRSTGDKCLFPKRFPGPWCKTSWGQRKTWRWIHGNFRKDCTGLWDVIISFPNLKDSPARGDKKGSTEAPLTNSTSSYHAATSILSGHLTQLGSQRGNHEETQGEILGHGHGCDTVYFLCTGLRELLITSFIFFIFLLFPLRNKPTLITNVWTYWGAFYGGSRKPRGLRSAFMTRGLLFLIREPVGRACRESEQETGNIPLSKWDCCSVKEWVLVSEEVLKNVRARSSSPVWMIVWNIPTTLAALEFSFYISGSYVMQVSSTAYPKWAGGIYCVALCWARGCYWTRVRIESVKLEATAASIIMMPKQTSFMTGCTHTGAG